MQSSLKPMELLILFASNALSLLKAEIISILTLFAGWSVGTVLLLQVTQMEGIIQIIGYITTVVTFITLIGGILFYVIKVKNYEVLKQNYTEVKEILDRIREERSDLKTT